MEHEADEEGKHSWKDWLWMVLCCVPMLAIIVLVALGYWSWY